MTTVTKLKNIETQVKVEIKIVCKELGINSKEWAALRNRMADGYTPTVKKERVAEALKYLGCQAWNPKTGKNW